MKTLKVKSILFSLFAIMAVAVFMTSCEQQEFISDDDVEGLGLSVAYDANGTMESVDNNEFALALKEAAKQEVTVEYTTLDELNRMMVEHGLNPFTEEEVIQARMTVYSCDSWRALGDWNRNGVFSAQDLVLAQQYLCANGPFGCYSTMSTSGHPTNVKLFGYLTYLSPVYGNGRTNLNPNDISSGRDFILGLIDCI